MENLKMGIHICSSLLEIYPYLFGTWLELLKVSFIFLYVLELFLQLSNPCILFFILIEQIFEVLFLRYGEGSVDGRYGKWVFTNILYYYSLCDDWQWVASGNWHLSGLLLHNYTDGFVESELFRFFHLARLLRSVKHQPQFTGYEVNSRKGIFFRWSRDVGVNRINVII